MPEGLGPPRRVRAWRPVVVGSAPDVVEALAHLLLAAARARGGPRRLAWLDSGGPARGPGAESVLTAFPVATRRFDGSGPLQAFLDGLTDDRDAGETTPHEGPSFRGGWVGHFSYECGAALEPLRLTAVRDAPVPLASWSLHPVWVRVVHDAGRIELWSRLRADHPLVPDEAAWMHWVEEALRVPFDRTTPMVRVPEALEPRPAAPRGAADRLARRAALSLDRESFVAAVRTVQACIREGEVFQANIANRFALATDVDPFAVYVQLRRLNPSPFACFIEEDWGALVSNSPERLFSVRRSARRLVVSARPIAGTRPRGVDPAADAVRGDELRSSAKERAEHTMLVDLARNDLGRVGEPGTVRVRSFQSVERYSHVQHLVSDVEARLRPGTPLSALVAALFPGGTVTGAPKLRSIEVIDRVEPVARGPYTGSAGYVNTDGTLDLNILIRTMVFTPGRVLAYAGAGIVADSDPDAEYEETRHKAAAMWTALATVEGLDASAEAPGIVEAAH